MSTTPNIDTLLNGLTDELAAVEHERWSHWQCYMHSKCQRQPDGSMIIPAEFVSRWERQATTRFEDLSESEKDSDREQVNRYLPIIKSALNGSTPK